MSRSRNVDLRRDETIVLGGRRARHERQRADLEAELATALACGDRERVSELQVQLEALGEVEVADRGRRADW